MGRSQLAAIFCGLVVLACVVLRAAGLRQQAADGSLSREAASADSFEASLMVSASVLDKVVRQEIPSILAELGFADNIILNSETSIRALPVSDKPGAVRLMVGLVSLKTSAIHMEDCRVALDFRVDPDNGKLELLNLEVSKRDSHNRFVRAVAHPLESFLQQKFVGVLKRFMNDRFKGMACYRGEYTVRVTKFEADEQGNAGVGFILARVGAEGAMAASAPIPLLFLREGDVSAPRVAAFWSDEMLSVLSGSNAFGSVSSWIVSEFGETVTKLLANMSPMKTVAAEILNSLIWILGIAKSPHLESAVAIMHRVNLLGVPGIVAEADLSNNGAGVMDSIWTETGEEGDYLKEWWNEPSNFKYGNMCEPQALPATGGTSQDEYFPEPDVADGTD